MSKDKRVSSSIRKLIDEKVAKSVKLVSNLNYTTIPSKAIAVCRDFTPPA